MKNKSETRKTKKREGQASAVLAANIPMIGFALFGIIPILLAVVVSFSELHGTDLSNMKFVGLDNYIATLTNADHRTYAAYFTTIVFGLNAPICIALSLYIAYRVNRTKIGKSFFQSVFFIPYVCSSVVISLTFKSMLYSKEAGLLNALLTKLGFKEVGWLVSTPWTFMIAALVMAVWSGLGWSIILYQAALANVDKAYYEAASIDGASSFQMFWKITWPAISPTTAYMLTMKFIWALQSMAELDLLAGTSLTPFWPGSEHAVNNTVVKHIYSMIFERIYEYGYGMAAAAGIVLAIIIFIVTQLNLKWQRRWVNYDF